MAISPVKFKIKGQDFLKNIPEEPGVYLMKDAGGTILYVGKAKNLKNRVGSYFQNENTGRLSPRIELLVRRIEDLEVVLTDTEVEALVLEFNLIKKYKPKFNIRLRDDKSYPYVRLDLQHPFPRLEYVRRVQKDGARYFGPFVSAFEIKDILRWAQKTFRLRDCSDNEFRNRSRPCILHQMGQCSAPCVGLITEKEYDKSIKHVLKILDGKYEEVIKGLRKDMELASDAEDFEKAGQLRDRIRMIEVVNQDQKISDPESDASRDLVHFRRNTETGRAVGVVLSVREGRTVGVFQFPFEDVDPALPDTEFLFEFLAQYYLDRLEHSDQLLPAEVVLPEGLKEIKDQLKILKSALGRDTSFTFADKALGKKVPELMSMVLKTAEYHLDELSRKKASLVEDLIDVQHKIDTRKFPHRIECYDISHFQGEGTVASRVVFIDGKPEKTLYRHYHVREVEGPDDYKSLREVLERRFSGDASVPDLVVIDGGKGQLAQAITIFNELQVVGVDLVSIAKSRTERDFQEAEIKGSMERIFKPGQKNPIVLKPGTGAFRVLTQVRDESHRFAITFHRKTRDKKRV